jgi:hypothetical protein
MAGYTASLGPCPGSASPLLRAYRPRALKGARPKQCQHARGLVRGTRRNATPPKRGVSGAWREGGGGGEGKGGRQENLFSGSGAQSATAGAVVMRAATTQGARKWL